INYLLGGIGWQLHQTFLILLAVWGAASALFQQLMLRGVWPGALGFLWSAADMLLLTMVLLVDDSPGSPITIGYPLLIAGAGLWFREALVWFTTACAGGAYAAQYVVLRLRHGAHDGLQKHVIFLVALTVLGAVVAYQVKRVRALSRYY